MCPNRYRVTLSQFDYERLVPWEAQLTAALAELVQEHLDENRWTTIGDIEVYLARDDELHTGVFGVASRMESNAPPRRRPQDSLSLPVLPGVAPGEYPQRVPQGRGAGRRARRPAGPASIRAPRAATSAAAGRNRAPPPPYVPAQPPRQARASFVVDSTNQRYELRHGSNVIGRGSDSDLQLLDQGVSRRHVDVQYDGQRATVYDLGSTNGTTVNGHEIGSHVLRHGDVVRLGHTRMVFNQDTA